VSDLVRVALVENEPAAEIAVGLLRVEGIRAIWQRAGSASAGVNIGSAGGISGAFDVLVLPQDAERPTELLAASEEEPRSNSPV
jgi:hypothetical protein